MNWPIAVYSQNGELPIKFAIERNNPDFQFSLRLVNQFADGWVVTMWLQRNEYSVKRFETLAEAESHACDLILGMEQNLRSISEELNIEGVIVTQFSAALDAK